MTMDDTARHNRRAWDREAAQGNSATLPVSAEALRSAAEGELNLTLTGRRPIPAAWLQGLRGSSVLCLACGGGQQVPLLAAAGAKVTAIDNSPAQVERDVETLRSVALKATVQVGDMRDLSAFEDASSAWVFIGLGIQFIPNPAPLWRETVRVLKPGGQLIAALVNPIHYALDWDAYQAGVMQIVHKAPYSDLTSLTVAEREALFDPEDPLEFGHTLEALIGGMLESGFALTGFLEDDAEAGAGAGYFPTYFLVRASRL